MGARRMACEGTSMGEVVIHLRRPALMTAEIHTWLGQRVGEGQTVLALGRLERSRHGELLLRVEVGAQSVDVAGQDLADLMMDMRLLGLRPALVADSPGPDGDAS